MRAIDLHGQSFGRLTVVALAESRSDRREWWCRCECGTEITATTSNLRGGNTRSCGCLQRESVAERNYRHGLAATPEYRIWGGIVARCAIPSSTSYKWYGALGITICDRWRGSFEAFLADMGPRPSRQHSIDRRDGEGPYAPENCRWATPKEQGDSWKKSRLVRLARRRLIQE